MLFPPLNDESNHKSNTADKSTDLSRLEYTSLGKLRDLQFESEHSSYIQGLRIGEVEWLHDGLSSNYRVWMTVGLCLMMRLRLNLGDVVLFHYLIFSPAPYFGFILFEIRVPCHHSLMQKVEPNIVEVEPRGSSGRNTILLTCWQWQWHTTPHPFWL